MECMCPIHVSWLASVTMRPLIPRLHTNCTALGGISDKHDVLLLSDYKRECLRLTTQAAAFLVGSIGNGGQATNAEYGMPPFPHQKRA